MIYKFLKNCEATNFFFEERFIFEIEKRPKDGKNVPARVSLFAIREARNKPNDESPDEKRQRLANEIEKQRLEREAQERAKAERNKMKPGIAQPTDSNNQSNKAEKTEKPQAKPKRRRPRIARSTVDTNKDKPADVNKGIEGTRKRVEDELGKEKLQPYIDGLKAAIEKSENADKLHKFIQDHNAYSGNSEEWNKDFSDTFALKLKEGEPEDKESMRYAAALQLFLAEYFNAQKKGDVFQTLKEKKANPFIYIDGKLGGYTVSALGAYWNDKFSEKKKEKGELGYAGLEKDFGDLRKNREIFGQAIDYLKSKLGGQPSVAPGTQPAAPGAPASAPTAKPGVPGAVPPSVPKPTQSEVKTDSLKLTEKQKRVSAQMVDFASVNSENPSSAYLKILPKIEENFKKQIEAIDIFNKKDRDPRATNWFRNLDISFISNPFYPEQLPSYGLDPNKFDSRTWPAKVFAEYKKLYEGIDEGPGVKLAKTAEKFAELERSIKEYYQQVKNVQSKLKEKYIKEKSNIFIGNYELPDKIDSCFRDNKTTIRSNQLKSPIALTREDYELQESNIKPPGPKEVKDIDDMFKIYLKPFFIPTKTPLKLDDWMQFFVGDSKEDKENSKKSLITLLGGGDEKQAIAQIREIIRLRNMYRLRDDSTKMRKDMDYDMQKALMVLNSNYDYFQSLKLKKQESNFADAVVAQIWKPGLKIES